MKTMLRLLQLWRVHAYLDFMWMTRDLKHFLICYISDVIWSLATITGMLLLAERFEGIGTWTKFQVVFMLGYATTVRGIVDAFFGYNVFMISRRLGRGQLDHTLVQPQPLWMALMTEGFTPFSGSGLLISGVSLMVWGMAKLSIVLSPVWFGTLCLNLIASVIIMLSFTYLWGSLAFWAPRAAEEISSSAGRLLEQLKPFPLDGLGGLLLSGMLSVVPVGFVAWYPCRHLLGLANPARSGLLDSGTWGGGVTPFAALVFASITTLFFLKGLKHYGKTGSRRYLGGGHRG